MKMKKNQVKLTGKWKLESVECCKKEILDQSQSSTATSIAITNRWPVTWDEIVNAGVLFVPLDLEIWFNLNKSPGESYDFSPLLCLALLATPFYFSLPSSFLHTCT